MKRSVILFAALSAFLIFQFTGCVAMKLTAGKSAYDKGDYQTAASKFLEVAEEGNPEGQYRIGSMYLEGKGVKKDTQEAEKWMKAAAGGGYPQAQTYLGIKYINQDPAKALDYLQKAAAQDDAFAMYVLGMMYAKGQGVKKDNKAARMYLLLARVNGFKVSDEILEGLK